MTNKGTFQCTNIISRNENLLQKILHTVKCKITKVTQQISVQFRFTFVDVADVTGLA